MGPLNLRGSLQRALLFGFVPLYEPGPLFGRWRLRLAGGWVGVYFWLNFEIFQSCLAAALKQF